MRVLIAAASFAAKISGLQRHAINMARCLLLAPEVESVHFAIAPWQTEMVDASGLQLDSRFVVHVSEMDRSSLGRNSWYYRKLPDLNRGVRADVVHLSYPMPIEPSKVGCPTVVTLHDLYPYEIPMNFGFPKFIFNRIALRQCLGAVDAITCVSEATKGKLKEHLPAFARKAVRVYNCVEPQPSDIANAVDPWSDEPFLLCVAQHRKNKNLRLLIRAYKRLLDAGRIPAKMRLLVVGISGPETPGIKRLISDFALNDRVWLGEGLSEGELQWCYRHCEALVAPSITEGFGLPVAEALLAGCRVICSEIPAHWEIGAGRCRFVNLQYGGEQKLADAIAASLSEARPRPTHLPELSAAKITRQYIGIYSELLSPSTTASVSTTIPIATSESQVL